MNNEELKKRAEEYFANKGYVEDSDRQWWDSAHIVSFETELREGFLAGHQLALEGASEGFTAWATKEGLNELCHFDGSSEAEKVWQARGLLAMKREGELLARIERLREATMKASEVINTTDYQIDNRLCTIHEDELQMVLYARDLLDTALAADKGE